MGSLTSGSRYTGPGAYESFTEGPGGGEFDFEYGGRGGGRGDMMSMFEAMFEEGMAGKKQARRQAAERHKWARTAERRARAPKLRAAERKRTPLDPMRYINQARQAARHAQGQKGGYTGIGQMAVKHEGERAAKEAAEMYPLYAQAMMMS